MKEDFLHYLWKYKNFTITNLKTTSGDKLSIIHSGYILDQAGPDFFNAQLVIADQKWAGNVEIHLQSSDWYLHRHELDTAYDNVILHVVWEHDVEIYRADNSEIPVLELKSYVSPSIVNNYQNLLTPKSWIFCEKQLQEFPSFILNNWLERLFFERLERKSKPILDLLHQMNFDWESVLFQFLAKNFGLNTNGDTFFAIAKAIPFSIFRKESFELENLEALLFGTAGLLDFDHEDSYAKDLKFRYDYLSHKYQLKKPLIPPVQFFKLRPDNFPTIRLAQWAALYYRNQNLFSKLIRIRSIPEIDTYCQVVTSEYWFSHYQLDKLSPYKKKMISKSFTNLVIINTIVPFQFAYAKSQGKEITEDLIQLVQGIASEKNVIVDKFKAAGIVVKNAYESQSLLELKNEYCNKSKCLDCAIGMQLLGKN